MTERVQTAEVKAPVAPEGASPTTPPPPPRRGPGHRGQDVRDAVAEMAARAQLISQEAGSKMSGALRDVILAGAGLAAFAVESARDLVQYMVRRGQMTQEEADKLIREAEEASIKRGDKRPPPKAAVAPLPPLAKPAPPAPVAKVTAPAAKPAAHAAPVVHAKPAVKAVARPVTKAARKPAARKAGPAKKPATAKTAKKRR